MTNSKNSSNPRATSKRGAKREKAAPGATDLDRPLKLASAQALASAGLYARTNVVLSEPRGEETRNGKWVTDITDVDVLSVVHAIDLSADVACMSCKGGTNVSVLHETFALSGVMRYLRARRGYGVFALKATEGHMIALGEQLDISLMDRGEWESWCRRINGPHPIPRMFEDAIDADLSARLAARNDLEALLRFLRTEFWYFRDYRNVQSLIVQLRRAAGNLNASALSQYVVLDAAALFALALLQMCEHVNTSGLSRLSETAPPYLFGGVPTYRNRLELLRKVEDLLRTKKLLDDGQSLPPLNPAYLPELLEIILRWCSKPAAAGRVPQYLNVRAGFAAAEVASVASGSHAHGETDTTEKFALDLIGFLGKAARLRPDLVSSLTRETPGSADHGGGTKRVDAASESAVEAIDSWRESEQPDLLSERK